MSTLLENPIKVNRIVTTSIEHARAIEDPACKNDGTFVPSLIIS
ncbi:MAG: hypothetical protein OEM89_06305 [Nitrosopumilus sp.]|nr:hypothetical protein [Nitrosopumilus sp.]